MKRTLKIVILAAVALGMLSTEGQTVEGGSLALITSKGAFEFNGVDEFLNLGRSSIVNVSSSDFTVHAWVKFTTTDCSGASCDMSIVDKMAPGLVEPNEDGWRLIKQADDRFWFCLGGGLGNGCDPGVATTVRSSTGVLAGTWYAVTAVKTSSAISIYVDGVQEATSLFGEFTDTNLAALLIGANASEGAFLNGRVRNIALFRRALSNLEIRALVELAKLGQ